jgi:hypothetical protein
MCDSDDANFVGCNLIENAVGEPAKNIAAPDSTEHCADLGIRQYVTCSSVNLGEERETKLGIRARGIKGGGILQLAKRERDNDQLHFSAARTLARASAIGMT